MHTAVQCSCVTVHHCNTIAHALYCHLELGTIPCHVCARHPSAVVKRGRIVEQGTHDELLAHNGAYFTLVQMQQVHSWHANAACETRHPGRARAQNSLQGSRAVIFSSTCLSFPWLLCRPLAMCRMTMTSSSSSWRALRRGVGRWTLCLRARRWR